MHRLRRQQRSRLTARASAPCYNKGKVERGGEGKSLHIRQCPPDPPGKLHPHLDTDTYCQADR